MDVATPQRRYRLTDWSTPHPLPRGGEGGSKSTRAAAGHEPNGKGQRGKMANAELGQWSADPN